MHRLIKIIPAVFFAGTVVTGILYSRTALGIFLTLTITFGTITYHFAMRLLVSFCYNAVMHNEADYTKHWYAVSQSEQRFYEKLKVKKWKKAMPTYDPDLFDPGKHTWEQVAQAMCQAELVHETIAILSLVPIIAGIWFGGYTAFVLTSIPAALFDLMFAAIQRYNRSRIMKLIEHKKKTTA